MTYANIAAMQENGPLRRRLIACAVEQKTTDPETWTAVHSWDLAAQPGWATAWASGLANNTTTPNYEPGSDETVITDQMILSAVQALHAVYP